MHNNLTDSWGLIILNKNSNWLFGAASTNACDNSVRSAFFLLSAFVLPLFSKIFFKTDPKNESKT